MGDRVPVATPSWGSTVLVQAGTRMSGGVLVCTCRGLALC